MVSPRSLVWSCHGVVWAGALALALWAGAARAAAARYDTATPHAPPFRQKYIPLHGTDSYHPTSNSVDVSSPDVDLEDQGYSNRLPVSQIILTSLRTVLEVVQNINRNKARTAARVPLRANSTAIALRHSSLRNSTSLAKETGRGFEDYYDEHHHHDHDDEHETTTAKPMKQGRYTDPWAGYYDWIINEGSFKFWSVFQLFTAALLLYACLSAIYYAKFNPIIPDYSTEYDDYFLERTVGRKARSVDPEDTPSGSTWINPRTFQFILDAIYQHYKDE